MNEYHAPWHAVHSEQGWDAMVYDGTNRVVATMHCNRDDGDMLSDLIAAAPALLEACQRVLANSEHSSICPVVTSNAASCTCYYAACLAAVRQAYGGADDRAPAAEGE